MSLEIERRFLIKNNDWRKYITQKTVIEQGYFSKDSNGWTIRIRSEDERFKLTLKKPIKNFTSFEFEYEIPSKDGKMIISKLKNKIYKDRFYLCINQKNWVVDIFKNENHPLGIAEIELESESEMINIPNFLSKEITGIQKFSNYQLAQSPISSWDQEKLMKFFNN